MPLPPLRLGVNIDHVATLRNARGGFYPDPVRAAHEAIMAGADGITAHLREDRRHIVDADIERLKRQILTPLNFEMAATAEMIAIAKRIRPHAACLVPEKRSERTTEGGLDVTQTDHLKPVVDELRDAGMRVSLFIEPEVAALEASAALGAPVVELHTGAYAEACLAGEAERIARELARLYHAAERGAALGIEVHAGHGLNEENVAQVAAIPQVVELNIGHSLIAAAVFVGLGDAVRAMREAMEKGRRSIAA
ncbi:pyridoxine 5'-phosphate synthase [Enterovirga rhinocerotis]|nr:pyridoxine 5'-phosphate synthase [Enterovirga rhinocerotis]